MQQIFPFDEEAAMVVNLFDKGLEKTPPALPESVLKANRLFIENVEKMLIFQMNSLKTYFDIGINQLRAAAEITDLKSLQDFCKRQAEIAQTVQCKLLNDARIMANMAARFKTEMDSLTQATLEETLLKAA
jgi:phasin family protein